MPVRLSTTVSKIASLPNSTNAALITELYEQMKNNCASESHTNNSLKTNMAFAQFLGSDVSIFQFIHPYDDPFIFAFLSLGDYL